MAAVQSTPRAVLSGRLRQQSFAQAVSSYLPRLTRKAFEKYGFASATLLTEWASIVGADVASYTAPERLKWPRIVDATGDPDAEAHGRPGATLVVRVDGPRAIELQHKARQIIERINAAFGYRAVAELRFVQAPIEAVQSKRRRVSIRTAEETPASRELAFVQDEALRQALSQLASSIRRESQTRAQPKSLIGGR